VIDEREVVEKILRQPGPVVWSSAHQRRAFAANPIPLRALR